MHQQSTREEVDKLREQLADARARLRHQQQLELDNEALEGELAKLEAELRGAHYRITTLEEQKAALDARLTWLDRLEQADTLAELADLADEMRERD